MYLSKHKKSKNFYLYYKKLDGRKTRISTKCKNKKDALKFLSEFEKNIIDRQSKHQISLKDFSDQYLATIKITHTKKSHYLSERCLKRFIDAMGENILLIELNQKLAENYILNSYSTAKHSAALQLRHLKAAFTRAIEWNYLENNPFSKIKLKIPVNHPVYINKDELELIIQHETNETLKLLYKFAFNTGMRIGEIVNLTWDDIDIAQLKITVRNKIGHTTKSKRERVLPMSKSVIEILNSINSKRGEGFVFKMGDTKFKETYVSKKFKSCVRKTKLNQTIHLHTLRHSYASLLTSKGAPTTAVRDLLGHSSIVTTQIYSHTNLEILKQAVKLLD